jgi:hypothetical protein
MVSKDVWSVGCGCKFLAVEMAFVIAFLDNPSENDAPYFAASNIASKKREEHLKDRRVANETAVTILATLSGKSVSCSFFDNTAIDSSEGIYEVMSDMRVVFVYYY